MNADDWIATTLAGAPPGWTHKGDDRFIAEVVDRADQHGVAPLLYRTLSRRDALGDLPVELGDKLVDRSRRAAASELAVAGELRSLLTMFNDQSVSVLLFKGTSLAYNLYPAPYLRVRCDTDMLFPGRDEADRAWSLLEERDYRREQTVGGNSISTQYSARRELPGGASLTLDMHWGLSNQLVVARCFDFAELSSRSIGVPTLHSAARTPSNVDALIIACLHRAAHRPDGIQDRAIWLYDIQLLRDALGDDQRHELVTRCRDKQISAVIDDGLRAACCLFGTGDSDSLQARLSEDPTPARVSIDQFASRWQREVTQFLALGGPRERLAHVTDHLFPGTAYVLNKYGKRSRWWLPILYARRFGVGIARRLRR